MTIRPGEVFQQAIWMTGAEPPELKAKFEQDVRAALAEVADTYGVIIGPLIMTELRPGEERVPPVPDYIQGPDVRLLVGEATVLGDVFVSEGQFVADLEPKDLAVLVTILRRVHQTWNPGKPELSLEKCHKYINSNGADAALAALRAEAGETVH